VYHTIIRRKLRDVFQQLNAKDYESILNSLGPDFEHSFYGNHALSGTRRTLAATRRWYERLPRVLPDLHFEVKQIAVSGWPWNTIAAVEWQDSGKT
jgi:ketosteroid isomerase-like protein